MRERVISEGTANLTKEIALKWQRSERFLWHVKGQQEGQSGWSRSSEVR